MFLTQVHHFKRSASAHFNSARIKKDTPFLSNKTSSTDIINHKNHQSKSFRRACSAVLNQRKQKSQKQQKQQKQVIKLINGRLPPQIKWNRLIEKFQMKLVKNDIDFTIFDSLLKSDLKKGNYKLNIPQTILKDKDSTIQMLYTTSNGTISKKDVSKSSPTALFQNIHSIFADQLRKLKIYHLYGENIDIKINPNAPFVVIRSEQKNSVLQVQNLKSYADNRRPQSCIVQRYIYSRNLKAMILRVSYKRSGRGQQHQEYCLHRFQNVAGIFLANNPDPNYLRAKITLSTNKFNTLQYHKITIPGALQHLIPQTNEVRRILQTIQGKRVLELSVDFIEDIVGKSWVIGYKGVVFEQLAKIQKKQQWLISSHIGYCRLCNGLFQKRQLQNNVSVRMLLQFLRHLRRRTRTQNFKSIQFQNAMSLNRKQNAMSAVCYCCYLLITHELELKKYERILGNLCNIKVQDEGELVLRTDGVDLCQWRLMVYLEEIKQVRNSVVKMDNLIVRYSLGRGIEQKWNCELKQGGISVYKVKVHYFFSETQNIDEFLKNGEIIISILNCEGQQILAQGSTGVLANFQSKFLIDSGQRQTTTVLLFFQSGKYCELTLKVGLVYDGIYRSPQIPMRKFNSVIFPTRDWLNSNPFPKQWMQVFGIDQQINYKQLKYQDLFHKKQIKSKLKKKPYKII